VYEKPASGDWDGFYERGRESRPLDDVKVRTVRELLDRMPGRIAVDLGCGTGAWTRQLAELGWDVAGYDYSKAAVECARSAGGRAGFAQWDIDCDEAPLGLVPGTVDLVTCRDTLAFLDMPRLAVDARRWLRPGTGRLYVMTPADDPGPEDPYVRGMTADALDRLGAYWDPDQRRHRIDDRHVGILLRAPSS
jgi:SAM-dependent methyltransferase